jgi:hypothetical protein
VTSDRRGVDQLDAVDGAAHHQDVAGPDAGMFFSAVLPFAHVHETDINTWLHAYAVNAVGTSHLSASSVVLGASSHAAARANPSVVPEAVHLAPRHLG